MTTFIDQARIYANFHQKQLNRYLQMAGISLVYLALMTLLGCIHISIPGIFDLHLGWAVTLILLVYYARLHWLLALTITPWLIFLCWLAGTFSNPEPHLFTLWAFLITLVAGGVICLTGYFLESNRPAPVDSLKQLIIAPLMMAAELLFLAKQQKALKEDIYGKGND